MASLSQPGQTILHTPPDSGLGASTRPDELVSNIIPAAGATDSPDRGRHKERGFLETVLGAPKAGVNQEPYVNTDLLQRPKRVVAQRHNTSDEGESDDLSPSHELDVAPRMMMRGRETTTRFGGSGINAHLVAQFRDIRSFAEDIRLTNPILSRVRPDLERVTKGLWKWKPLNETLPVPTAASLISLLPTRAVADELVGLYLTYVESTHRILHIPSFLRDFNDFWATCDTSDVPVSFIVQLLLVLAIAWNLADMGGLQGKSPAPLKCYAAVEWVLHAEKWLNNTHVKRPEITSLRLRILLITALNCYGMNRSQAWLATGQLVKSAMMAGYHRDPSKYARISVFSKEMRRRVWMTIVELDLQVAIDRGMPPSVQSSDFDSRPALNINDDEIHESVQDVPEDRSASEITDCSFATSLARSLSLRLKACHLMHSPRINCRYEEIQRIDWELSRELSRIPVWASPDITDHFTQQKITLWKAMSETKLAQSLLSIHTPFAIEARCESLFAPSARSRMDAAVMILSMQRQLQTSQPLSQRMLGEWTHQAFVSICQILYELGLRSGESSLASNFNHLADNCLADSSYPAPPMFLLHTLPGFADSLLSLVETALVSLEGRYLLVIKGAKDYFFLSTIVALVRAKLFPVQSLIYKQQVVERVLSFAQTLFSRHSTCSHLGVQGMGSFKDNQVISLHNSV